MSARDNGGWAFPQPMIQHSNGEAYGAGDWDSRNGGMTLRDWFAGQAITGLLASGDLAYDLTDTDERAAYAAFRAFAMADAMLAERQKGGA